MTRETLESMAAEAEQEKLLDALANYGQHLEGCPLHWDSNAWADAASDPECECGLNEILEAHGREGLG